jgi:hypothetical protein
VAEEKYDGRIEVSKVEKSFEIFKLNQPDYTRPITEPEEVEIARKGNNFRAVMERKLGIDWEHSNEEEHSRPEDISF